MTNSTVTNEAVKSAIPNASRRSVRTTMRLEDGRRSVRILLTQADAGIQYNITLTTATSLSSRNTEISNELVPTKPTTKTDLIQELTDILSQMGWSTDEPLFRTDLDALARSFFFALIPGWVDTDVLNGEPQPEKEKQA